MTTTDLARAFWWVGVGGWVRVRVGGFVSVGGWASDKTRLGRARVLQFRGHFPR